MTAAPLNSVRPLPQLSFVTLADILFVVAFVLLVPHFAGTRLELPSTFVVGVAGTLAVGSLASIASLDPALSFNHMLRFAVGAFLLAALICWWQPRMETVVRAAGGYVLGNVVSVVGGLIEGPPPDGRHVGLSTHPNVMGLCDVLALALVPFLFVSVRRENRWLVVLGALGCAYGIWINGSRGALVTAIVILVLYPAIVRSLSLGLAVTAVGFLGPIFVSHVSDRVSDYSALGRLLGKGSAQGANTEREEAARVAIDQFNAQPLLGGGFGPILEAHNVYLQIAAAVGIFGLVFFLGVMWSLVRPLLREPPPFALLSVPALAYAMAGMVFNLLWDRYIWCVAALALVGPILASRAATPDGEPEAVPSNRRDVKERV